MLLGDATDSVVYWVDVGGLFDLVILTVLLPEPETFQETLCAVMFVFPKKKLIVTLSSTLKTMFTTSKQ